MKNYSPADMFNLLSASMGELDNIEEEDDFDGFFEREYGIEGLSVTIGAFQAAGSDMVTADQLDPLQMMQSLFAAAVILGIKVGRSQAEELLRGEHDAAD